MGTPALAIRQGVLPENTAGSQLALRLRLICLPSASAHTRHKLGARFHKLYDAKRIVPQTVRSV